MLSSPLIHFFLTAALWSLPDSQNLPECLPGWKLEVVASAPQIRHPTVVCCSPDGRVFVAEDPMDISAPSADLALGRILCFHPDGKVTVFGSELHAVFGMQYVDGKLYVLHNPRFSVFRDADGTGKDRVDLIECMNPNPWALDWNDHVPANFRLAMDGFFYVAVGDKGIHGAVGTDGKGLDLHGGGILRLRPNGSELEVYSTGVRNILDVALNSEDEIFTYDNTDEEQWMSRVTHMVDGGFYGYPYDFIPRKPYTLWAMADYGSGAATGTVAYNEDGLPPEYHGNLFLADFGKRQILRLRLEREGGSYRVASREDLVLDPPHDFRPVGIAVGPDGTSLYICDWNHTDTKEKVEVGRLLKLVYTGKSLAAPRPHWYLKAAMGQEVGATPEQLMQGLSHPAHGVRLVAQRRLAERGPAVIQPLAELLSDASAPSHARWHALWALDAIDGGSSSRKVILNALGDPDLTLRRQIIRQLGGRRVKEAAPLLARELKSADAAVRFQAATQLGRIGLLETAPALLDALDENDLFTRFAIFTALGRIGRSSPGSWASIVRGLESEREAVRAGTEFALREVFDGELVQLLAKTASDAAKPTPAREAALNLLTGIHRKKPVWKGEWWAYHPVHAPPPRKTEEWAGTESVLEALRAGLEDPQPRIRRASVEGLREARDVASLPKLRELFLKEKDLDIRGGVLSVLGELKDPGSKGLVSSVLLTPGEPSEIVSAAISCARKVQGAELGMACLKYLMAGPKDLTLAREAIEALGELKVVEASETVSSYGRHADPEVRQAALGALAKMGGASGLSAILSLVDDQAPDIRRSAVKALGILKAREALPRLLQAYEDPETRFEAMTALAEVPDVQALDAYLDGLSGKNAQLRESCGKAIGQIQDKALPLLEARLAKLSADAIRQLQEIYDRNEKARKTLLALSPKVLNRADYLSYALKNKGDPSRGRRLFTDQNGVACIKCHALKGVGGSVNVGPDLAGVGVLSDRQSIAESILEPSKVVREGYQQVVALTKGGEVISGLFKGETGDDLTLQAADGSFRRVLKADLLDRKTSGQSLMPEGLQTGLSLEDFADLVSFVESLRGSGAR